MQNENIKLIRNLKWEEVFLFWYQNEGNRENWNNLAKERGYASWAEWRLKGYAERFECDKAEWGLYEIYNPSEVIKNFYGGPFRTWIKNHYDGEKTKSFGELAKRLDIINQEAVHSMKDNYPKDTIITCMETSDEKVFVIEGSHRACALAVMAEEGRPYPDKLVFAIGKSKLSELPEAGKAD